MKSISLIIVCLLIVGCANKAEKQIDTPDTFSEELTLLKDYFQIPGMAAVVVKDGAIVYENYLGLSNVTTQTPVDSTTVFPVASLTKIFSGALTLKMEEQGKLSLDDPVNKYIPNHSTLNDSILIKHVLSHTSQGDIGKRFYYSSRFGLLTHILGRATGKPFAELMTDEILTPLALKNSFFLEDSLKVAEKNAPFAMPYVLDNGIEDGYIEYGYSSSAGLVSNARDLAKFSNALDTDVLMTPASRNKMFSPFQEGLPYGYGIFSQEVNGVPIVWAYGQYDCYSSLFLKVPSQNITLILLANNNLMSDPARLIYGDVSTSLFALSFLKNHVFDQSEISLFHNPDSINLKETEHPRLIKKMVLAQALSESFMARFDTDKMNQSTALLEQVFQQDPNYMDEANLTLLHNLSFLKDVAFYKELGDFNRFDSQIEQIGRKLLKEDPSNPYLNMYFGYYFDRKGMPEKAEAHFRSIVEASNFWPNWYTREAEDWLDQN